MEGIDGVREVQMVCWLHVYLPFSSKLLTSPQPANCLLDYIIHLLPGTCTIPGNFDYS